MRAVLIEEFADPAAPVVRDVPEPEVPEGYVVVELVAADLQPLDRQIARGLLPGAGPLPLIAGVSAVGRTDDGRVHAVLAEMTGMGIHRAGCFSERFAVEPKQLIELPDGADPHVAASIANGGLHARRAVVEVAAVQPGETLLVLAGAGAFGRAAAAIAASMGIKVVSVTRRASALASIDGVTEVTVVDADELPTAVLEATDGRGVDAILDSLGGDYTSAAVRASAPRARHVLLGHTAGVMAPVSIPAVMLREHRFVGMNGWMIAEADQQRLMAASLKDIASGLLVPDISATFTLDQAPQAYAHAATSAGRVVLTPA